MMKSILALFAFGFLLQSCTLQKRTLMPGWHLERVGQASTYDDVERLSLYRTSIRGNLCL